MYLCIICCIILFPLTHINFSYEFIVLNNDIFIPGERKINCAKIFDGQMTE